MKVMPKEGVMEGGLYRDKSNKHYKNEKLYAAISHETVLQQLQNPGLNLLSKKHDQFAVVFHLLSAGTAWSIAESIHHTILEEIREFLNTCQFFSVTCDETITVDTMSWISVHIYVVTNYARSSMLLKLEKVIGGSSANNITEVIIDILTNTGNLSKTALLSKFVCFGADGVNVFQGCRNGVTMQLQRSVTPYMIGIHCVAHRANLAVKALSAFAFVSRIEDLLKAIYGYFKTSSKRQLEFKALAEIMETRGAKIIKHVATRWVSLLDPCKKILAEYHTLVVKMALDSKANEPSKNLYRHLCDLECLLGLASIVPLMEAAQCLMKFAQARDVYIGDFAAVVLACQEEIQAMYLDPHTRFYSDAFRLVRDLCDQTSESIKMKWVTDLNTGVEHLCFKSSSVSSNIMCTAYDAPNPSVVRALVTKELLEQTVLSVKTNVIDAAQELYDELANRFPSVHIVDALGIVYPQYWLVEGAEKSFEDHLNVIKVAYCHPKVYKDADKVEHWVPPMLNEDDLDAQALFFKRAMKHNSKVAMQPPYVVNPLTCLWQTLGANSVLRNSSFSKYFKLFELTAVMVVGSVEDERVFSIVNFVKSKVRNKLSEHLDVCVGTFVQSFFTLQTFPFEKSILHWKDMRRRCGLIGA